MFHWSPKYFFTAVLLIIAASSAFVQGQFNNLCIRDPQQILESELVVKNTAVDRYYFLCNNVIFFIKPYDWTGKAYSSDTSLVRPLIFIYPNAHILCGLDGNVNNNCTMSGGTLQLEVVDANYFGLSSQKITNVSVQGVKFMNLGADATIPDSANVYIFGTPMGAELLVEDCVFQVWPFDIHIAILFDDLTVIFLFRIIKRSPISSLMTILIPKLPWLVACSKTIL